MRRFFLPSLLTMLVALAAPGTSGAAPSSVSSWSYTPKSPLMSDYDYGVVVDGGRVWWLEYRPQSAAWPVVSIGSRALSGGAVRRVQPNLAALLRPDQLGPFPQERALHGQPFDQPTLTSVAVRDGHVFLLGGWRFAIGGREGSTEQAQTGLLAEFDGATGALVRQQTPHMRGALPDDGARFLPGAPAVVSTLEGAGVTLSDPQNDQPSSASGSFVAGGFVSRFTAAPIDVDPGPLSEVKWTKAWSGGNGYLEVSDLATGALRYRLAARQIARRAHAVTSAGAWAELQPNGSLAVAVDGRRGGSLAPTVVDSRGKVVRLGRPTRNATGFETRLAGQRALVAGQIQRRAGGRWRRCTGLWVTNRTGSRARRLGPKLERAIQSFSYWDGRYLVSLDYPGSDSSRVRMRAFRFDRLALGHSGRLRCS